mgnify:FL=1
MVNASAQQRLFDDLPDRDQSPLRARWWTAALAFHATLLLVPIAWHEARNPSPDSAAVAVTLITAPLVEPERAAPPDPVAAPQPVETPAPPPDPSTEVMDDRPPKLTESGADPPVTDPPAPENSRPPGPPPLGIQRLLETVAAMDWSQPESEIQTLGRSTESELTEWLRQPVLALGDNTFDGMTAPTETEVMDRWMSPGGEHNVVIRAPDGNTYCGRQGPVDDLRPWLQMPMLFHRCAGGGKRGGASSWRNN